LNINNEKTRSICANEHDGGPALPKWDDGSGKRLRDQGPWRISIGISLPIAS
jgi:hypothetical protein